MIQAANPGGESLSAQPHDDSVAKIFGGSEHGLPMFDTNPGLEPELVAWLQDRLLD